jgi:hypothetical protein
LIHSLVLVVVFKSVAMLILRHKNLIENRK